MILSSSCPPGVDMLSLWPLRETIQPDLASTKTRQCLTPASCNFPSIPVGFGAEPASRLLNTSQVSLLLLLNCLHAYTRKMNVTGHASAVVSPKTDLPKRPSSPKHVCYSFPFQMLSCEHAGCLITINAILVITREYARNCQLRCQQCASAGKL